MATKQPFEILEKAMAHAHLSQRELATELGLSNQTVYLWVSNKMVIGAKYLKSLHKILDVDPKTLRPDLYFDL